MSFYVLPSSRGTHFIRGSCANSIKHAYNSIFYFDGISSIVAEIDMVFPQLSLKAFTSITHCRYHKHKHPIHPAIFAFNVGYSSQKSRAAA